MKRIGALSMMRQRHCYKIPGTRPRCFRLLLLCLSLTVFALAASVSAQSPRDGFDAAPSSRAPQKTVPEFRSPRYSPPQRSIADLERRFGPMREPPADCSRREDTLKTIGSRTILTTRYLDALSARKIAEEEALKGNYADALRIVEDAMVALPKVVFPADGWGEWILLGALHYQRSRYLAFLGKLDEAERAARAGRYKLTGPWINPPAGYREYFEHLAAAAIAHARGRHQQAEASYRAAMSALGQIATKEWLAARNLGDVDLIIAQWSANYLQMGRLVEAEIKARSAARGLLVRKRYSGKAAVGVERLAEVLLEQGRTAEATALARRAINMHEYSCALPDSLTLASARHTLAKILASRRRWTDAMAELSVIEAALDKDRETLWRTFGTSIEWPLVLARTGQGEAAVRRAERAIEAATERFGREDYRIPELRAALGVAYAVIGDPRASTTLASAIKELSVFFLGGEDFGTGQRTRDQRFTMFIETYLDLLRQQGMNEAKIGESFRLVQLATGRVVHRALAASSARAASRDPGLAALVRRQQDTRQQVAALLLARANFSALPREQQDPETDRRLREDIARLRNELGRLNHEIQESFPRYTALMNPRPVTLEQVRRALLPGESLLVFHVGEGRSFVWAVPHTGPAAFASVDMGEDTVDALVVRLRTALEPDATTLGEIPSFDLAAAETLYSKLMKPVATGWRESAHLLAVTTGPLGSVPIGVLPLEAGEPLADAGPLFSRYRSVAWLARHYAVTNLPSVASLVTLRDTPTSGASRRPFIGFGDPVFSGGQTEESEVNRDYVATRGNPVARLMTRSRPQTREAQRARINQLPPLPDTRDELIEIAAALKADPGTDVLTGTKATEATVKSLKLSDRRVIAFATHGLVPGDLDGLDQPALALSAPSVVGGDEDGVLTMGEILSLELDADLVVLSACNSGAGEGEGAEAISGLGRAFFYAGARALLVSNWPVETTSARALITQLFERLTVTPGISRAEALRQSMIRLMDGPGYRDPATGQEAFTYAHPLFWAPFVIVGEGAAR